jgi:protein TonB
MNALVENGSLVASCTPPAFGGPAMPHSRGALAAAVVAHVIGAFLFVKLLETARVPAQPPIEVQILEPEKIEQEPPPKKKPPEVKKEEPPPPPVPEPPPEVLPEPLPQVEMPLPPVLPPIRQTLREPVPPPPLHRPEPAPMREPVVQRPVEPVRAPPPPAAAPRDPVREMPAPPILTAKAPTPVQTVVEPPRPQQPVAVPEAPRAPREPPRRRVPNVAPAVEVAEAPMPELDDAELSEPAPPPLPIGPAPEGPELGLDVQTLTALYLRNPKPGYPAASKRQGEQGTVVLRVFVTAAGDAKQVSLKTSSGFSRLDRAALETVKSWKFVPAKRDDNAVDAWVLVPIKFSLTR